MHGHPHNGDHGHDHEHGHFHQHGHSHRTGAATRYWREPKPLVITTLVFVLMVFFVYLKPISYAENGLIPNSQKKAIPRGTRLVLWQDGSVNLENKEDLFVRIFEAPIEPSCEFRNQTLNEQITTEELERVHFTYCTSLECVWTLAHMAPKKTTHLVTAELKLKLDRYPQFKIIETHLVNDGEVDQLVSDELARSNLQLLDLPAEGVQCKRYPLANAYPVSPMSSCKTPGDRSCDSQCSSSGWFYRSDLASCVNSSPCTLVSASACSDETLYSRCRQECNELFLAPIRKEATRNKTVAISLLTLFLLGFILGLLFAKLFWVDPLLTENERLKIGSH